MKTKNMFLDLSQDNKVLVDSSPVYSNTRTKFLQAVDRWLSGKEKERENASRVMAIYGRPGIGKTCIAAEICRLYPDQLAGFHFFQFLPRRPDHNFVSTMLLSMARQLSNEIPSYASLLPRSEKLLLLLAENNVEKLFEVLIYLPLQKPDDLRHDSGKNLLLIIDAVDECYEGDRNHLFRLLNSFDLKTPEWLYLFFTIRDDNQLTGQLDRIHLIELKGTSEAMTSDIKRFFKDPMSRLIERISLDPALAQLTPHAQGTFLGAYLLKKKLENYPDGKTLPLKDIVLLPTGFSDLCKEHFQQFFNHMSKIYSAKEGPVLYNTILGILVTAKEKLSKSFIKMIDAKLETDDILNHLKETVDVDDDGFIGFHHKSISEWLQSEQTAAPLSTSLVNARQKMADLVTIWLGPIVDDSPPSSSVAVPLQLQQYALKHAMEHLTDVPRQNDNIARLLCCLRFIEEKLTIPGVTLADLVRDYDHSHYQTTPAGNKLITLDGYMKKSTNLAEQIEAYRRFVNSRGHSISRNSKLLLQFAANYPTVPRIQQNARIDLSEKPWLEDLTGAAETPSTVKVVDGRICQGDLSADSKSIVVLTQGDKGILAYIISLATGEASGDPIDLNSVPDRTGLCIRFLPDNNNMFVGSLSSFIAVKTGKPTPSGFDVQSVKLSEKYSIECCDVAASLLVCGITTLPSGGRSLHVVSFDLKTKVVKMIEVLKFRFGGSAAQTGIKSCSLSPDASLLGTCVKQTTKVEVKVWSTSGWNALHSIDVENDTLSRCYFVDGNQRMLICGGVDGTQETHQKTYSWNFQGKTLKVTPFGNPEYRSVCHAKNSQLIIAQRCPSNARVTLSRWKKGSTTMQDKPDERHVIHGLTNFMDVIATEKNAVFLSNNFIRIYKLTDLVALDAAPKSPTNSYSVYDSIVVGLGIVHRSDDLLVVHRASGMTSPEEQALVSRLNVRSDGTLVKSEVFSDLLNSGIIGKAGMLSGCFQGTGSASEICACTPDGVFVILNTGNVVKVCEISSGSQRTLPGLSEIKKTGPSRASSTAEIIRMAVSTKDPLVGISYSDKSESIFLFDLKAKTSDPTLEIGLDADVADFCFIPHNGYVMVHHRKKEEKLTIWNQRTGASVSVQTNINVAYARLSPASDRIVLSLRQDGRSSRGGFPVLRNSDGRFNIELTTSGDWNPEVEESDLEFSGDGTIVIGVSRDVNVYRIWNAGKGEVLKDLSVDSMAPIAEIGGMITNIHALFNGGTILYVCDIVSGDVVSAILLDETVSQKASRRGLRISSKGNVVVASTENGAELRLFQCHNLQSVKRKTTLQLLIEKTK